MYENLIALGIEENAINYVTFLLFGTYWCDNLYII